MMRQMLAVGFLFVGFTINSGQPSKADGKTSGPDDYDDPARLGVSPFDDFDPGRLGIYLPPKDSNQGGRTGGGDHRSSQSIDDHCQNADVILSVLAPDDSGLTSNAQPAIFWYFSGSECTYPVQFTLSNPGDMEDLINATLSATPESGIHRIDLANFDVNLSPNIPYVWHITLVRQERKGLNDITSGGTIKYVPAPEPLATKISQETGLKAIYYYARNGYWYDAFMLLSRQIAASSDNQLFRKLRICLVKQVGLSVIAQQILQDEGLDKIDGFDLSQCHTPPLEPSQN